MKMMRPETQRAAAPEAAATLGKAVPAAPRAVAGRATNLGVLVGESATRAATSAAASTAVFALAPNAQTWSEWVALQTAVAQRLGQLQQSWWQGWGVWLEEFADLRRANTLSEFTEQQYNLFARLGELTKDQTSSLLSLQENVQVDYGYWASRKLRG
jgi:hypothetical protein